MELTVTECSITSHPLLLPQDVSSQRAGTMISPPWPSAHFGQGVLVICLVCVGYSLFIPIVPMSHPTSATFHSKKSPGLED